MPNIKSAIKRVRQNEKRRLHNASRMSRVRTFVKKLLKTIATGDKQQAQGDYIAAQRELDKAATKNLIHKNKASRTKKRLVARIKNMTAA